MTRRLLVLMGKDLAHHAIVGVALLALMAITFALVLLGTAFSPERMTYLDAHAAFMHVFAPLTALFLGHRLVVREYSSRTQLFVEALPIRSGEHLLAKFLLGLLVLWGVSLASLVVTVFVASFYEALSLRWVALIAARTLVFTVACWSFFFSFGLLGRWRVPFYIGLYFFVLFLTETTDLELTRFAPIALVGETFVLERQSLPYADLGITLALAAAFGVLAFVLGSLREGSVAESLAKKMSQREKVAAGVLLLAGMTIWSTLSERREKPPFAFQQEEAFHHPNTPVHLLYLDEAYRTRAEALAAAIAEDLRSLGEALGWKTLPPVHLALRSSLDHRTFEATPLSESEGLLVHANFVAKGVDDRELRAFVVAHAIEIATDGRAAFEPLAWVRTALAEVWVRRDDAQPSPRLLRRVRWIANQARPRYEQLRYWNRTRERFGEPMSAALAYGAGHVLQTEVGRDRFLALARDLFGERSPRNSRPVIALQLHPFEARLQSITGLDAEAFEQRWLAFLQSLEVSEGLALSPSSILQQAELDVLVGSEGLRNLRYRLPSFDAADGGDLCVLLHKAIGPFDGVVATRELGREERPCSELGVEGAILSGRYGSGERVLMALERIDPALDVALRLGARRLDVP